HSHIDHLLSCLDICMALQIPHVSVHAFLDGRDTSPYSSPKFIQKLFNHPSFHTADPSSTHATLVPLMGRYWAMDRDQRWDRIEKAYRAITGEIPITQESPLQVIQKSHESGKTDEFIEPTLFDPKGAMQNGDSVL